MSKTLEQKLSLLMDGEITPFETKRLVDEIHTNSNFKSLFRVLGLISGTSPLRTKSFPSFLLISFRFFIAKGCDLGIININSSSTKFSIFKFEPEEKIL